MVKFFYGIHPHLRYLAYLLRHKLYVLQEGRKLGVPLWGLIIHDWQKVTPAEWKPYALSFYGPWGYERRPRWLVDAFDYAWVHHQHFGPHHYQYWILVQDDGETKVLKMPKRYMLEMIADWRAASKAITGKDNTEKWYKEHRDKIRLHQETRTHVERILARR